MKYLEIKEGQYAVAVADSSTGKVLNLAGRLPTSEEEPIFHVFDSLDEVYGFIRKRILEDETLEFSVNNQSFEVVQYIQNTDAKALLFDKS